MMASMLSGARILVLSGFLLPAVAMGVGTALTRNDPVETTRPSETSSPVVLAPGDLVWKELPTGVRVAILQGDPEEPGPFTLRLSYPAGYRKEPHYHPGDAYVTVLEGSYHRGYGPVFDESKGVDLHAGTFSVNPAGVSHYEWTTQPVLIQVQANGPWTTIYVDPEDRPIARK